MSINKKSVMISVVMLIPLSACDRSGEQSVQQTEPAQAESVMLDEASLQAYVASSRSAIKALGGALKTELKAAMSEGGPVQALDVCHTKAPELAALISAQQGEGVAVGRTSLKHRNKNNAPVDWQLTVLNNFESRKQAGEDVSKMEYSEVAAIAAGKEFRYMKAIPAGEVCMKCHGTEIDPAVMEKIISLYPDDQATGYQLGDVRGAFVVTKPL